VGAHKEINRLEQTKTVPLAIDATAEPVPVAAELTNFANAEPQIGIGIGMLADAPLSGAPTGAGGNTGDVLRYRTSEAIVRTADIPLA